MDKVQLPSHHPDEELLLQYAAGNLTGGRALIIATHLAYCRVCRGHVAAAEVVGGEMLENEAGADVASAQEPPAADLGDPQFAKTVQETHFAFAPNHLRTLLQDSGEKWINVWFGVKELPIPGFTPVARLLWIPAGRRMPRHDHQGEEMTLVLKGSFTDATGRFAAGDLQVGLPGLDHQPHAGTESDCVCLVVEQGGLKLSGWLGRLVAWRGGRGERTAA